jgi:trans-2,3-dihydro-3-hydroxyanthranilate isomerase
MVELRYRILNVFTLPGDRLSGNPLCVFEDGSALETGAMQALARQFNLSETTFILPASAPGAAARVRIFTPSIEMPFAGHPTLGTAHVVRDLKEAGDRLGLEMEVGVVDVAAAGDRWTLRAAVVPAIREPQASSAEIAAMLGFDPGDLAGPACWVDVGSEQLVVPLASARAVASARPDPARFARHGFSSKAKECMAYVFAEEGAQITARFFFLVHGGLVEDPATGSACANLGGYFLSVGRALPLRATVSQGAAIGRPSSLELTVDASRDIFVGGEVIEIGRGVVSL